MRRKLFAIVVAGLTGLVGGARGANADPVDANRMLEKLAALETRMAALETENRDLRRPARAWAVAAGGIGGPELKRPI